MLEDGASDGSLVRLEHVHKTYQMGSAEVHALAGVTLSFQEGDFLAIMGPSGSGKSTMLNLLGCLDRPTSGHYFLKGYDVGEMDDDRLSNLRLRELGFIFQSFNLIPQLTVQENIELPLYYLGWEAEASRLKAVELAAMVGLGDRLQHRPMELSGGQQQRVAIARSLANEPSILLADEPTGNLDSANSKKVFDLMKAIAHEQNVTLLVVTHNPSVAEASDIILEMKDGEFISEKHVQ